MDALITNTTAEPIFIPGPNLELAATGDPDGNDAKTWSDITVADLDGSPAIKQRVLDGDVTVELTDNSVDAAVAAQGTLQAHGLAHYTFANLPTGFEGRVAFVTNGRKTGEGGGAGTGVPAYFSDGSWRVFFDDSAVVI